MKKIPYGYCHCGCGLKTPIAPQTRVRLGWTKGEPIPFINNHHKKGNHDAREFAIKNKPSPIFCEIDGEPCVRIPLTKGKWTIVSLASYDKVKDYPWLYSQGFACRVIRNEHGTKVKERMHRTISGAPKGVHVGHRNENPLDNRDSNLIPPP